jgi:hypothetical protein
VFFAGLGKLHGNKLVSLLFETLEDFSNETTLDAIGLDLHCNNKSVISSLDPIEDLQWKRVLKFKLTMMSERAKMTK